jgi:hypothetical protein
MFLGKFSADTGAQQRCLAASTWINLLFRMDPMQHGDVHTVANYDKFPSELHRKQSDTIVTIRHYIRTGN